MKPGDGDAPVSNEDLERPMGSRAPSMTTGPGDSEGDAVELDEFGFDDERWLSVLRTGRQNLLGRLGGYDLVAEVGRGGQGVVYRGRQPGTGREVALKRLVAGAFATEDARKRFEREVEAATALRHPGVVTIYGIEMVGGEPILAMEWIDGVPITRWAASDGGRSVDAILRSFVLTCEAVAHAHRHGVIHRDLKPSNILVDREDRPRVLDFGMAKLSRPDGSDAAAITGSAFAGTIAYASPEQIGLGAAAVDTRTDVYSLGVVLYELLALRPLLPRDAPLDALVNGILRVDPPPPSASNPRSPRELDHVVMMAIAKDRDRRYASVEALAADVRRFLAGEAVEAHPPSRWYRARKLVARHRLASALVAVIAALGIAFVATTLDQAAKLEIERDAALAARKREFAGRCEAERRQAASEASIKFLLEDMIGAADPALGGRDLSLVEAVDKASARVGKKFAASPELEAAVRRSIGEVYHKLARYPEAERELRRAVALWRKIPRPPATNRANANVALAWTLMQRGMRDEARALLLEARDILKPLGPDGDAVLAHVLGDLATLSVEQGKFAEAADLYRESLAIATRLGAESLEEAPARQNLAVALLSLGKPGEARAELEPLLAILDRSSNPDGIAWADTVLTNMGWAEVLDGRVDEGVKLLRRAAAISEKRYGSHPETAATLNMLARALARAKELPEAEEVARRALAMHRTASEAPRRHLASTLAGLARICGARGKQAEGEELMAEAAEMYAALGSRDEAALATAELETMRRAAESRPPESRPEK
jgi:eukaryotic-like serine/threonine-protein kinase